MKKFIKSPSWKEVLDFLNSLSETLTNHVHPNFKGATTTLNGKDGFTPAPKAGANNRYLRSDATWATIPENFTKLKVW